VAMDAGPAISDHDPTPTDGTAAVMVAASAQTDWLLPATAVAGRASREMATVAEDAGQTPLATVHAKIFTPTLRPVTAEDGLEAAVTEDPPDKTCHTPVPTVGTLAARVAAEAQTVWLIPGLDGEGRASRVIVTVEAEGGHTPFEIVYTNLFMPTLSEVTAVEYVLGETTTAGPERTDHDGVPVNGELPAMMADEEQTVWGGPAAAASGRLLTVIVNVLEGYIHDTPDVRTRL
jgi:hypothetical protein